MVAPKNNLPLIEKATGTAVTLKRAWLRQALVRAAEKAGYSDWWPADDLVSTVLFYLEFHYPNSVIGEPQLETAVRCVLRNTGYQEVARYFGSATGWREVSLLQLFREGRPASRRGLASKLASWMRAARSTTISCILIRDLKACAEAIRQEEASDLYAPSQEEIATEIVEFVRARVEAMNWQRKLRVIVY